MKQLHFTQEKAQDHSLSSCLSTCKLSLPHAFSSHLTEQPDHSKRWYRDWIPNQGFNLEFSTSLYITKFKHFSKTCILQCTCERKKKKEKKRKRHKISDPKTLKYLGKHFLVFKSCQDYLRIDLPLPPIHCPPLFPCQSLPLPAPTKKMLEERPLQWYQCEIASAWV